MRFFNKMPSFANLAAGSKASLVLPLGYTYQALNLVHNFADLTKIKNVKILLNGRAVQEFDDLAQVEAINAYYKRSQVAGTTTIWFYRPELATVFDRRLGGIGTLGVGTLVLEFDVDASVTPAPVCDVYASLGAQEAPGLITHVRRYSQSSATAGEVEVSGIPKRHMVMAMHLKKADITGVRLETNKRIAWETSKALGETLQKAYGRVPQTAAYTHLDFLLEGDIAEVLNLEQFQDVRIMPTLGTSGAFPVLIEYLAEANAI